jgi:hypothetical protein
MHHRGTDQCQCQTCDAVRSYCTFKVSDCDALFVPSDATTCNVYVPGAAVAVVGFPAPDFEEPPPQAVRLRTAAIAKTSIPRRQMTAPRDRSIHGSRSKAAMRKLIDTVERCGLHGGGYRNRKRCALASRKRNASGLKLQVALAGRFSQVNVTVPEYPIAGVSRRA